MVKHSSGAAAKKGKRKAKPKSLSLHPLSLETAIFAAMQTGPMPKKKGKKVVDKSRRNKG
jgi:hypothetical protein